MESTKQNNLKYRAWWGVDFMEKALWHLWRLIRTKKLMKTQLPVIFKHNHPTVIKTICIRGISRQKQQNPKVQALEHMPELWWTSHTFTLKNSWVQQILKFMKKWLCEKKRGKKPAMMIKEKQRKAIKEDKSRWACGYEMDKWEIGHRWPT